MRKLLIAMLLCCAAPAWAGCEGLQVADAWVRAAPPGATMLAGYATVKNTGKTARTLHGVSSKDFDAVEIHKTVIEGGVSKMLMLETVNVAPQGEARFEPTGMHLMLFTPKRALKAGDTLQLAFSCGGKSRLKAKFVVKDSP